MRYFDAHCHIQFDQYANDRDTVIASMREKSVGGLVVGTDLHSSVQALALAQNAPDLWVSAGLHPNAVGEGFDERSFADLIAHPKVVAVGECGLDNFRPGDPETSSALQKEVFETHVRLALAADKPLMIHARPRKGTQDAYQDALEILRSYAKEHGENLRGDIHFFVGGTDEARAFIELGFTLSFTAVLTFARDYDEVVRFAPLESLITETDSPYLAPARIRGQRNDPTSIPDVVAAMAEIRGEDEETVRQAVLRNAQRLFRIG